MSVRGFEPSAFATQIERNCGSSSGVVEMLYAILPVGAAGRGALVDVTVAGARAGVSVATANATLVGVVPASAPGVGAAGDAEIGEGWDVATPIGGCTPATVGVAVGALDEIRLHAVCVIALNAIAIKTNE
jgi:hypothetical protein